MSKYSIPENYPDSIRKLRAKLGLTQTRLAELLGVSFASVNRWENGQSRPGMMAWRYIIRAEHEGIDAFGKPLSTLNENTFLKTADSKKIEPARMANIDFTVAPEVVRAVVEAERLALGHLFSPAFATETSRIDPLPHQRIAVYEHMLKLPRLRFLLADDAGAGKTIMAGLYIREMLSRRLIRRILVVPPAGLLGNWEREMRTLFNLPFRIISGADSRSGNPFTGPDSHLIIVSMDTLSGGRTFQRLAEEKVEPYDLVIFDEAHKLSADRNPDFTVRRTDRYRLAEALAGASIDPDWSLPWHAHHLLLLTATPHMGRDYPYFCLWRLLEPEAITTLDAFNAYPPDARKRHFLRRTKEEMVRFDGTRIYPTRISDTPSYDLLQGEFSEQRLYDETTAYVQSFYNRARILNRSAARLAMSIFQRRLASSTFALMRSFERRLAKLKGLIDDIRSGRMKPEDLEVLQHKLDAVPDVFDVMTGDEESAENGREQNEVMEDRALSGVITVSLPELEAERDQVQRLLDLARRVYEAGQESKFEKLSEVLRDPQFKDEKILVFTEHRDTLHFLVRRLEGLGFAGKVAQIHGGMAYKERGDQVEFFRKPAEEGGATYMVATDAAGEGINLQFCWLMVNYDIPWNPARLEQRMGRIHRYKQQHDPVLVFNLVAGKTREGRVLKTLLDKLELIRKELGSDKVFDVIGRQFEGVSLKELILNAVLNKQDENAVRKIEGILTPEQVTARLEKLEKDLGTGGDVSMLLPEQRAKLERDEMRRLIPGYVRRFVEKSAPMLGIGIEGDLEGEFSMKPLRPGALDPLWPVLETHEPGTRERFTVYRPPEEKKVIFLHPGEPFFDRYRHLVSGRVGNDALKGGVFVDPYAERPYFFHVALVSVSRKADPSLPDAFGRDEPLEVRLVGLKQEEGGPVEEIPVEHLMLLKADHGVPAAYRIMARGASISRDQVLAYARDAVAKPIAEARVSELFRTLPQRMDFVERGYAYQDAELAAARAKLSDRLRTGDPKAKGDLTKIKQRQRELESRKARARAVLRREPELITPDEVQFIAHALVVPSSDPEDRKRYDREVENTAVIVAWEYEEARGRTVQNVSTPPLAQAAGLGEHPGFDLLSTHPDGTKRAIEVKGRARIGDVELSENEWAKACILREQYWLYVIYDCASAHPRLVRVQDPFKLLVKARGGVVIDEREIFRAAEGKE